MIESSIYRMPHAAQAGILEPAPRVGRYLFFSLSSAPLTSSSPSALSSTLQRLAPVVDGRSVVLGLGLQAIAALGAVVPGLRAFPDLRAASVAVPATPTALWCWLRGDDLGELVQLTQRIVHAASPALQLDHVVDGFRYGKGPNGHGLDLTGYEDGTENPHDDAAVQAALVHTDAAGLQGSSFVAVQQWVHDFAAFEAMSTAEQDDMVGRRRSDNEELDDAPESAHVKRTAQESFEPEAFVLRRSMPWTAGAQSGLMFVSFGHSLDGFEAQLRRMAGLEDGIVDALFRMSKPITGAYFWCPPVLNGGLDLRAVGL